MNSDYNTPAPGVSVRAATSADSEVILGLIVALAEFERLDPPDEAARRRLLEDAFGPNPRFEIFLAELEGQVAGYAFVFETYSTFLALPSLYLEDLFVLPEFRSRRVGYALMMHCARQAWARGCGRMEWAVLDWNTHAIDFYERLEARHLDDWRVYRLDRSALKRLAAS
jgi:GNAT superfamily N-acetyltransferase